ncbi:MAG: IS1595 family transposase [Gammaproteobacteria bacterium]|nr:IS1595 family transposase [Gammaproteobacteria bacterium]MDE0249280.1 IS1595 family transposase [Gammaproteobacteria bacterium]
MTDTGFNAPGRAYRQGISLMELADKFPDEEAAIRWFEAQLWPSGERCCGHCGSLNTAKVKHRSMPYRCRDCRQYFSVRTGTALASSRVPLRKWAFAIYLQLTSSKGVSSMKLHRDIGVTQKTAWFMLHRIKEAYRQPLPAAFIGPVEADESYFGGKKPKHIPGRGTVGKTAVVGVKDRATNMVAARVVRRTNKATLQGFIYSVTVPGALVYTDDARAYQSLPRHESVKHSVGEYVRGQAHTNGVESFWATLKRAYHGVFHKLSPKHLDRYIREFAGKHNLRDLDTIHQNVPCSRNDER